MLFAGERPQSSLNGSRSPVVPRVSSMNHSNPPPSAWSGKAKSNNNNKNKTNADAKATEKFKLDGVQKLQHIWVVTGPAGCGKSTVCADIQKELSIPFLEGDDFHPTSNKEKMGNGTPLTDEDRWDWLISLRNAAIEALSPSEKNNYSPPDGVVVACSALKRKYRDVVRVAAYGHPSIRIHFIYLKLDEKALVNRLEHRKAHYMKSGMIYSQLQVLEEPTESEWDMMTVDVDAPQDTVRERVYKMVTEKLAEYE